MQGIGALSAVKMLFHKITSKKKKYSWKDKVFVTEFIHRRSNPEVLSQKGFFKNFAQFTRKQLRQGLFFNKVTGLSCFFIQSRDVTYLFSDN